MPKFARPDNWEGYECIDVKEAARRSGRSERAIRHLVRRGQLKKATADRRTLVFAYEIEGLIPVNRRAPLRLLDNSAR